MDISSGSPFWSVKNGLTHAFPPLERDIHTQTLILGGGITGALIARELTAHGHEVTLIESGDIARQSTAASTALIQYEIDTPMTELAKHYNEENAARAYLACVDAISELAEIARPYAAASFQSNYSLYLATKRHHVLRLRKELELRRKHGIAVQWIPRAELNEMGIDNAFAAIRSMQAASVDPHALTFGILQDLENQGVGIYDRTAAVRVTPDADGVSVRTDGDVEIRAKHVIAATGYFALEQLGVNVAKRRSTYAFVTEPMSEQELGILDNTLLWETARPYVYVRTTADRRLMVGGEDDSLDIPLKRDLAVPRKTQKLLKRMKELVPQLDLQPSYAWAGTFAETPDGLPYFGPHPRTGSRLLYAMGYGGNGITYSVTGASILRSLIENAAHPLSTLYSFSRLDGS